MDLDIAIHQSTHHNVIVEIYQNQESGLYGLNIKIAKFNFKIPAKYSNLEALEQITST